MTPNHKPIFVAFEGLDGSGKSTTAKLVAEHLGAQFLTTPSPQVRTFRDQLIASLGDNQEAHQLFYLSTVFDASRQVASLLDDGRPVVIDRYFLSTQAYAAFRGSHLELDNIQKLLTPADFTVYLDTPLDIRRSRLAKRGMSIADKETVPEDANSSLRYEHFHRKNLPVLGEFLHIETGDEPAKELARHILNLLT